MSESTAPRNERSYGCSMGDGNAYDYILIDVQSSDTLFLCVPCYIRFAMEMVTAITDPGDSQVADAIAAVGGQFREHAPGPKPRLGRKNAPVGTDEPEIMDAFDSVLEADDLSDEFR